MPSSLCLWPRVCSIVIFVAGVPVVRCCCSHCCWLFFFGIKTPRAGEVVNRPNTSPRPNCERQAGNRKRPRQIRTHNLEQTSTQPGSQAGGGRIQTLKAVKPGINSHTRQPADPAWRHQGNDDDLHRLDSALLRILKHHRYHLLPTSQISAQPSSPRSLSLEANDTRSSPSHQ